jgi:hypothetical protein
MSTLRLRRKGGLPSLSLQDIILQKSISGTYLVIFA